MSTENFYFDDFTADYYLSKDDNNVSHLKVVENFTTVFPDYNQNKGICREIPFTNMDGKNVTLPKLDRSNIKLFRNGQTEPIYSIEKYKDYYEVCTGDETYVLGRQVYTFEYEYSKVITDFSQYQELYWDTNGNGWTQKFNTVVARLHFAEDIKDNYGDKSWCYVGKYGESGQERCNITKISDGVQFRTENLLSHENLTFDAQFDASSFNVPEPELSYILSWALVAILLICLLTLIFPIEKLKKTKEKIRFYKDYFVKPEYQPHKDYSIAEMSEVFIGKKKDAKVGMLLDLIVKKRVQLLKAESKTIVAKPQWVIKVVDAEKMSDEEKAMLAILNGGFDVANDDKITLRSQTASSAILRFIKKYKDALLARLKLDGLVENTYKVGNRNETSSGNGVALFFLMLWLLPTAIGGVVALKEYLMELDFGKIFVYEDRFTVSVLVVVAITIIIHLFINHKVKKYKDYTLLGLEMSRYMDGLKMYIRMAESERLKMLQSVDGVDTSPDGIVKLYEKLLPYAAIFGLEESWMKELERYYKMEEVNNPDWFRTGITAAELSRMTSRVNNYIYTPSHSSGGSILGGGGFSSSSSGGGGGGFSGGGGGGGGGHGR